MRSEKTYFWKEVEKYLSFLVPAGTSVLEVGYGKGPMPEFKKDETFDYIVLRNGIGYFDNIQESLDRVSRVCKRDTRVIIVYVNRIWEPLLKIAELVGLVRKRPKLRWVSYGDIRQALYLNDFEVVKEKNRILLPFSVPFFSTLFNKFIINLPLLGKISISKIIVARRIEKNVDLNDVTCSVIIPCRNEKGNVEDAVKRTPNMGKHLEFIFVEGHSSDGTLEECQKICSKYKDKDIKVFVQEGRGKGDAVRKGFTEASGDVLMILDADLTVTPEDLPEFFNAIVSSKGEFINGSRLVYKMERQAMRLLNFFANKFFSVAFTYLLEQKITDTLCGTKVLWKSDYERIANGRVYFGNFDPFGDFDLLFGAAKLGLKIIDVPITYKARTYGETQISRFRDGWLLLQMTFLAAKKIKFL